VTKPMDLGSVKNRLRTGYYDKAAACISDVELVFNNCFLYNKPNEVGSLSRRSHPRVRGTTLPRFSLL
jgi:hypothetical protein